MRRADTAEKVMTGAVTKTALVRWKASVDDFDKRRKDLRR
jgi:hypothetical protein